MFWCIMCDGYESRGKDILVVGHTDATASEAMQLRSLTDRIRVLTNSASFDVSERFQRRLAEAGIDVIHDKIDRAFGTEGQLEAVITASGRRLQLDALFSI